MRILITTRKLNETDMLIHRDILRREYSVDCLSEAESKKMLCEKALCAPVSNFPQSVDIDSLVKVCGGIPLVLEMVASKLKRHLNNVPLCNEMVKSLKEALTEGEGDMSEKVVDVVYNSLDENCREAFLDISCFFHNRGRRIVAYAVGIVEFQALEDAALVKVSPHENYSEDRFNSLVYFVSHLDEQQGIVRVHDIVRARGRRLSQGDRITDMEPLEEALGDTQMLQKIKGIRLSSEFTLEAEQLDRMNSSLRVLDNEALQINGRCRRRFPNLRYVDLGCGYLPMDLNKLKRLSVLSRPSIKDNVCELPSSLHLLRPSTVSNPDALLKNLGYLLWLEDLYIADPTIVSLSEYCLGQLKSLRFLDMSYSTSLSELPEDFGYLHALEGLSLNHCSQLASLTPNFGGLRSLKFLDMGYCEALVTNLSALQQLNLSFCSKLATLPPNFGQLSSLLSLNLYSTNLSAIPDSFGDLLSLKHLKLSRFIQSLSYLDNLDALPDTFGNLISLQTLDLRNCSQLASLPQSFSQLTHLETLDMSVCEKLSALPREFGQLKSLTYLNISDCKGLRTLSDCDFRGLTSLGGLNASGCSVLEGNSMDVLVQMRSLIFVNINESPMLMARWQQVRERHPLIMLRSQSYSEGVGADWDEAISISLFHGENMFSYLDVDRQLAFRSTSDFPAPQAKLAFVMTMCDLSSPANTMALEMVKTKCAHLASQDFHIIFVEMENLPQKSEERMCQNLLHLPPGTHVWMAAGSKINQVFCNVLYARLYEANVWRDSWTACHTFVASASVSVEKDNKRCVRDLKRMIPDDNDDDSEALTDLQGGFKTQFHSLHEMGTMMTRRPTT